MTDAPEPNPHTAPDDPAPHPSGQRILEAAAAAGISDGVVDLSGGHRGAPYSGYLEFADRDALTFSPADNDAGSPGGSWNWSIDTRADRARAWPNDPVPVRSGTDAPDTEMLGILRQVHRQMIGMTGRGFLAAAQEAGAVQVKMENLSGMASSDLPTGMLPGGRAFVLSASADDGFPPAGQPMPAELVLEIYRCSTGDIADIDHDSVEPHQGVSAQQALGIIRRVSASAQSQDYPQPVPRSADSQRRGPARRRGPEGGRRPSGPRL